MKRNALYALLFLFLGAALAEWLSTPDAHAQALPPSSGGTSYTHPNAISLSQGIHSSDGGTFNVASVGAAKFGDTTATPFIDIFHRPGTMFTPTTGATTPLHIQGVAGVGSATTGWASSAASSYAGLLMYSETVEGCWGYTRSGGFGSSLILCPYRGSGDTMALITGHPTSSTYGLRLQSYNGSALETAFETVGGWPKIPKENAGAPAAGDCDAASEAGRIVFDTTNFREYRCFGTSGWKYSQML